MSHRRVNRLAVLVAAGVLAPGLLGGCTSDDPAENPRSVAQPRDGDVAEAAQQITEEHNDADVAFAQEVIPRHQQALDLVAMLRDRDVSDDLLGLSRQIEQAQGPELEYLREMLATWEVEVAAEGAGQGPLTESDLQALQNASGEEFEQRWAQAMIDHHEAVIQIARNELGEGINPQAEELALTMIEALTDEIEELQAFAGVKSP